ncbi:MAG: hypothetical protein QOG57_5797 [Pseudonocardiales bacterium]|nr:hypothetical protein [Pseudonocardiales bacterium]
MSRASLDAILLRAPGLADLCRRGVGEQAGSHGALDPGAVEVKP